MKVTQKAELDADTDAVWHILADIGRTPEWNPVFSEVKLPRAAKPGKGLKSTWQGTVAGIPVSGTHVVTAWKERTQVASRCHERHSGINIDGTFDLAPTPGRPGTVVTATLEINLPKLIDPLVNRTGANKYLAGAMGRALANLGQLAGKAG